MDISIVVCTWNWAEMLSRCLDSLCKQVIPTGLMWEVVVVDNNSTDQTQKIITEFKQRLPLREFLEPRQGISFARNKAVLEARGELIIQIDTDALAHREWLRSYWEASQRWPSAEYFGGAIEPLFESEPAPWVLSNLHLLEGAILIRDLGPEERKLAPNEQAFGANLAYRASVFTKKKFNVQLGHVGQERLFGEETEVLEGIKNRGGFGVWVPQAKVSHFVPDSRVTKNYLRRYFFGMGRSHVRLGNGPKCKRVFGAPRPLLKQVLIEFGKYFLAKTKKSTAWVEPYIRAYEMLGIINESRRTQKAIVNGGAPQ